MNKFFKFNKASYLCITMFLLSVFMISRAVSQEYRSYPIADAKPSSGINYYLPKTNVVVKFSVEKTVRTEGIYASSAYLIGVDNTKVQSGTTYKIKGVKICPQTVADYSKEYFLSLEKGATANTTSFGTLICVNKAAGNLSNVLEKPDCEKNDNNIMACAPSGNQFPIATKTYESRLMEQGLMNKYPQMSAEAAAAEIKRLRAKQIEILSGSLEGTYLNTTVDYMYKQLDEIINSYVQLFVGTNTTVMEEYSYVLTPEKPIIVEEDLLIPICKFSAANGMSDLADKTDGMKIIARIHSYDFAKSAVKKSNDMFSDEATMKKINKDGAGVYYTIPEQVKVTINLPNNEVFSRPITIIQYGTSAFTANHTIPLSFNPQTGEIIR